MSSDCTWKIWEHSGNLLHYLIIFTCQWQAGNHRHKTFTFSDSFNEAFRRSLQSNVMVRSSRAKVKTQWVWTKKCHWGPTIGLGALVTECQNPMATQRWHRIIGVLGFSRSLVVPKCCDWKGKKLNNPIATLSCHRILGFWSVQSQTYGQKAFQN